MDDERLTTLAEVLVYGPLMLHNARSVQHKYLRAGLVMAGILTIAIGASRLARPPPADLGAYMPAGIARRRRVF